MRRQPGRLRLPGPRAAVVFLLVLLEVLVGAGTASAHADLETSSPAAGSELASSPAIVTLDFSEAVTLVPRSIVIVDGDGARVDSADAHHPASDATRVTATLRPGLPVGSYSVLWHVISDDSHPVSGSFTFGVGVAPRPPPTPTSSADTLVTVLHWVAELLALLGIIVLAGSVFFIVWLWPEGRVCPRARRVVGVAVVAAVVGNALLLFVGGTYGAGGSATDLLAPSIPTMVSTTAGRLTALRLAVLVVAFFWWRHRDRSGGLPSRVDVLGLWLLVAVTQAVGGHPGHSASPVLSSLVDAAHLTAVSTWVGGLVLLGAALLRGDGDDVIGATVLQRWSRVAATAVAVIVLTGAASAFVEVGSWSALVGTAYGRLVLGKAATLLLVVAVAAFSRRQVARVVRGVTSETLRRLVGVEALGAVVILGLTAALISTAPGRETYLPTMSTTVNTRGGPVAVTLHVTVRPTTPGFEGLTVEARSPEGDPLPIEAAQVRFVNEAQHIGPMEYPVATTAGAVRDALVSVPGPGRWDVMLTLQIRGTRVTGAFSYGVGT